MKLERLYNVLVLGGAALTAGCDGESEGKVGPADTLAGDSMAKDDTGSPAKDSAITLDDTGALDSGATDAAPSETAVDAAKDAPAGEAGADAACAKTCSALPLPCCWMADCTTDPSCKAMLCP